MRIARRSFLLSPIVLACKRGPGIDPDIAAWLGESGDPPTPRLFAKLSKRSKKDDVAAAFAGTEAWGATSTRAPTNAAPGLEWIEFQFPSDTLYCVTVVYSQPASTPQLWTRLLAALRTRYGPPKNQAGDMFLPEGMTAISTFEKDAFAGHRVKFFL